MISSFIPSLVVIMMFGLLPNKALADQASLFLFVHGQDCAFPQPTSCGAVLIISEPRGFRGVALVAGSLEM